MVCYITRKPDARVTHKVSFECADVFNFNPSTGKIE
jgi:hypothetical protein